MLALDFINVGNGDSILVRQLDGGRQTFAMMVDFGHDCLIRDDHPDELDPRSQRIYAGDFLRRLGMTHLDLALATHFHRDHIGGLGRVLDAVTVGKFVTTYLPPETPRTWTPSGRTRICPRRRKTPCSAFSCIRRHCRAIPAASENSP